MLLIGAAIAAVLGWRGESRLLAIQATATYSAAQVQELFRRASSGMRGASFGQTCEIVGVIESDEVLIAPLSGQPCIAYRYTRTDEEWGKAQMGMLRRDADSRGMVLKDHAVHHDEQRVRAFWVRDATGRVRVELDRASLDLKETDRRYDEMLSSLGNSERRSWHVEYVLPMGHPVYVLGALINHQNSPAIACNPVDPRQKCIISYRSEQQLLRATRGKAYIYYFASGIAAGLGVLLLLWRLL